MSRTYWICRICIGHDNFEEHTVGLDGSVACEICDRRHRRPEIACVSENAYRRACLRLYEQVKPRQHVSGFEVGY
jgi:hypothetical protein